MNAAESPQLPGTTTNPRWIACAKALGVSPDDLRAVDFLLWMGPLIDEYRDRHCVPACGLAPGGQDAFTAFVEARAAEVAR